MKISVIISAYNEEKTIKKIVNRLMKVKIPRIKKEIIYKFLKKGIRIYEVPISYAGREFSEGKN